MGAADAEVFCCFKLQSKLKYVFIWEHWLISLSVTPDCSEEMVCVLLTTFHRASKGKKEKKKKKYILCLQRTVKLYPKPFCELHWPADGICMNSSHLVYTSHPSLLLLQNSHHPVQVQLWLSSTLKPSFLMTIKEDSDSSVGWGEHRAV